jgi:hypothetical protein
MCGGMRCRPMSTKRSNRPSAEILNAWLSVNSGAPAHWRALAERLAKDAGMASVWQRLCKSGDITMVAFASVCNAYEKASREVGRQTSSEEAAQLERVKRRAAALKVEIEKSPLPKNWATLRELTMEGSERIPVVFGWRDLQNDGYGLGHPIAIVEILDLVAELVDQHKAGLPPRVLARHHTRPLVSAFIRQLSLELEQKIGRPSPQTLACIGNAVLDPEDPLDKDVVKTILKNLPAGFTNRGAKAPILQR